MSKKKTSISEEWTCPLNCPVCMMATDYCEMTDKVHNDFKIALAKARQEGIKEALESEEVQWMRNTLEIEFGKDWPSVKVFDKFKADKDILK